MGMASSREIDRQSEHHCCSEDVGTEYSVQLVRGCLVVDESEIDSLAQGTSDQEVAGFASFNPGGVTSSTCLLFVVSLVSKVNVREKEGRGQNLETQLPEGYRPGFLTFSTNSNIPAMIIGWRILT